MLDLDVMIDKKVDFTKNSFDIFYFLLHNIKYPIVDGL